MEDLEWHKHETYKSMITYGQGMLRFVFLVNAGAILSILTFLGNVYAKNGTVLNMRASIVTFLLGLLFAGMASMSAYFIQFMLFRETVDNVQNAGWRSHVRWLTATLACVVISLGCFAVGSLCAVAELT